MKIDPEPVRCPRCDFGSGHRGMDRCRTCDGVGSVFIVNGKIFPNTEAGFCAATTEAERASKKPA